MPEFNATLIFVMISFIVFMLLMKAVYFDPILRIKHERERKVIDDRDSAQRFAEELERLTGQYEAELKRARKEAHQVIQEVRTQAKNSAQQTLTEARANAQIETDRQVAELDAWREATYRQLESDREALARTIVQKVTSGQKVRTASGG